MSDDAEGVAERNHLVIPSSSQVDEEGEASVTEDEDAEHPVRLPLHVESESSSNRIAQLIPSTKPNSTLAVSLNEDKDGLIEKLRLQIHQMETQHGNMLQRYQELETQLLHHADPPRNQLTNRTVETETSIMQKQLFQDEKHAIMESQLNQALQTADTLRTKLSKCRRSITEDHLVLEDLKGERNQLRQEVAQLKRKSQLIVSVPREGFDVASSSLSFLSNNYDGDEESMSRRRRQHSKSLKEEKRRSSLIALNDTLVIQQLKEERDHLQSQLDEAHRQNKETKAASKKVEDEDKLMIQELKNELYEIREKLARSSATTITKKRKSVSTHSTMDESSRQSQSLDENNGDDEKDLLIEQLKQERAILQSQLLVVVERKPQDEPRQQQELVVTIQQLTEERDELRMKLLVQQQQESSSSSDHNMTKLGGNNSSSNASLGLPSLEGSFQHHHHHDTIDGANHSSTISRQLFPSTSTTTTTTPTKAPYSIVSGIPLPPSGIHRRSSVTSVSSATTHHTHRSTISTANNNAKLNELRAHKHSVETQLKTMVSPHHPKSMIGNLQKELSTNQQIIQEQQMLLHQSQTKQKSHERIIAEQKIQLRLLAKKIQKGIADKRKTMFWSATTSNSNTSTSNNTKQQQRAERLDRWKNRMQQDIEEKFDALLEQYSRQLDFVDRAYDVRTYTVTEQRRRRLPDMGAVGGGLFFWAKVLFIFLLWNFRS